MNKVVNIKGESVVSEIQDELASTVEIIVARFFAAVVEMHTACNDPAMQHASFRDEQGRVYSMPAIMRIVDRHMNFIRIRLGTYQPSQERPIQPTNPRR